MIDNSINNVVKSFLFKSKDIIEIVFDPFKKEINYSNSRTLEKF